MATVARLDIGPYLINDGAASGETRAAASRIGARDRFTMRMGSHPLHRCIERTSTGEKRADEATRISPKGHEERAPTMLRKEAEHPFYRPLWVRIVLTTVLSLWCLVEWMNDQPFWGLLTGAAALWAVWTFFITYRPDETPSPSDKTPQTPPEE